MHFTLPHKNKKKTAVRHTFQTFITLSHWFLIFVNKRERLKEDERTRRRRRWRTRYVGCRRTRCVGCWRTRCVGCWRTGHGGHRPTKEGDMQASDNIVRQAKDIIVGRGSPRPVLPEITCFNWWKMRSGGCWRTGHGGPRPTKFVQKMHKYTKTQTKVYKYTM